jgi:hypothetical protein
MKGVNDKNEWKDGDELWDLLGKSERERASVRFVDDTVRAVKLLPQGDSWWPKVLQFSPLTGLAACLMLGVVYLMNGSGGEGVEAPAIVSNGVEESWVEIEAAAEVEMLTAAADHLDQFSDQELVSLIGF